ncbi:MAG: hypothetical protein ACTHLP_18225, partial [Rhizobiaceae bacterium]
MATTEAEGKQTEPKASAVEKARARPASLGPRIDGARRRLSGLPAVWSRFWRVVSRYMPKRLYARSLIIVIAPMILLQSVVTFVFMERQWQTVTNRLSVA